ncbi:MAG: ATP-binding cassette domain-containing protein [Caldilineales bacterium]
MTVTSSSRAASWSLPRTKPLLQASCWCLKGESCQGLFTILTIRANVPVMNMKKISRSGFIDAAWERGVAEEFVDKLRIATSSIEKEAAQLSGGNQQKVVLSKCLFADADLLMLDEPTRGVDVGARAKSTASSANSLSTASLF